MTTQRPEIIIEGSRDGADWQPYELRWKPGALDRAPSFIGPHMPRLDWQMWFAALNPRRAMHWLLPLVSRLLDGEPGVLGLLGKNPFPDDPPRRIRLSHWQYEFTTSEEREKTGNWWKRTNHQILMRPLGPEELRR